jgi:hypothetical protein
VPIVLKSGRLNLLENSGHLQACNGIALPLVLIWEDVTKMDIKSSGYNVHNVINLVYYRNIWQLLVKYSNRDWKFHKMCGKFLMP